MTISEGFISIIGKNPWQPPFRRVKDRSVMFPQFLPIPLPPPCPAIPEGIFDECTRSPSSEVRPPALRRATPSSVLNFQLSFACSRLGEAPVCCQRRVKLYVSHGRSLFNLDEGSLHFRAFRSPFYGRRHARVGLSTKNRTATSLGTVFILSSS